MATLASPQTKSRSCMILFILVAQEVWTSVTLADKLASDGWAKLPWPDASDLLLLAVRLGTPIPSRSNGPLVDRLLPLERHEANPNSLSAHYGKGPFPFHTDSANFPLPPRYVLLRLAPGHTSNIPTYIHDWQRLDLAESEHKIIKNDVWFVYGGHGHFYTPILNETRVRNRELVRFDQCCMRPATSFTGRSAEILNSRLVGGPSERIDWKPEMAVVLDNWRMLHARAGGAALTSTRRVLERVLIEGAVR
jgi:hypothetical protein